MRQSLLHLGSKETGATELRNKKGGGPEASRPSTPMLTSVNSDNRAQTRFNLRRRWEQNVRRNSVLGQARQAIRGTGRSVTSSNPGGALSNRGAVFTRAATVAWSPARPPLITTSSGGSPSI